MSEGWHQVIDRQLALERWARSEEGIRVLAADFSVEIEADVLALHVETFILACRAPAYYVTPEMTALLSAASESLESWTLRDYDFAYPIAPAGFAWCAGGVGGGAVRGLVWSYMPSGMVWWLLGEMTDGQALPIISSPYHMDEETRFEPGTGDSLLAAFIALCRQKVAVPRQERLPRAFARRAERARLEPQISIVTLRRPLEHRSDDAEEEEGGIDWSHRWLVDAHWRAQWFPSELRHRPIWIAPYIKGPEDKPLILKRRVFMVKR